MSETIVEGQTATLDWQLKADGVAQNLDGMSVIAVVKTSGGAVVSTTDDVSVLGSTSGVVRLSPDAVDFRAYRSPYSLRFAVTDANGKIAFFPSGDPIVLIVRKR